MMTDFWKTKKFIKLSKVWAEKLEESGFKDHEVEINGERKLIMSASSSYRGRDQNTKTKTWIESKTEYFNLISYNAMNDDQMPHRDRTIMVLYSNGVKQRDIIKELEKGGKGCNRITITRTITRYLHRWNIPILKPRKTK